MTAPPLAKAIAAYLATLDKPTTVKAYASTLRALAAELGTDTAVAILADPAAAERLADWTADRWPKKSTAPATWNRHLDTLRSAVAYWRTQGWLGEAADPLARLARRPVPRPAPRAKARADINAMTKNTDADLRDRTLWTMLYETAARASEVLSLDIPELDLANRSAPVRRKGGGMDVIVWRTATATLLPRLLKGRTSGPVFLTHRRARVALPAADIDPATGRARLSYDQAERIFKAATGWSFHDLRHSALTHAGEDGTSTPMLKALSGHASIRSLERYARISPQALANWQADRDPARRKNN